MSRLKVVRTGCTDPYVNLAAEEYLTMNAEDGAMTLFLWQNARTVVIGRNQNPWRECDVESIKRDGISLARRMSGGGAVYHDMGNLNFTFIARDGLFDISKQTDVILHACRLLGINASKTGRNDLTVAERKFSGHAYFSSGGFNYHHGTIMMDVAADDLSKYLNVSEAKLKSKGVASVISRVTNLRDHLDEPLRSADTKELIAAIKDVSLESEGKIKAAREAYDKLTDAQKALVENLELLTAAEKRYEELAKQAQQQPCMVFFRHIQKHPLHIVCRGCYPFSFSHLSMPCGLHRKKPALRRCRTE